MGLLSGSPTPASGTLSPTNNYQGGLHLFTMSGGEAIAAIVFILLILVFLAVAIWMCRQDRKKTRQEHLESGEKARKLRDKIKSLHWRYNQLEDKYKPGKLTTILSNLPDRMDSYFKNESDDDTEDPTHHRGGSSREEPNLTRTLLPYRSPTQIRRSYAMHSWSQGSGASHHSHGHQWPEPPLPAEDRLGNRADKQVDRVDRIQLTRERSRDRRPATGEAEVAKQLVKDLRRAIEDCRGVARAVEVVAEQNARAISELRSLTSSSNWCQATAGPPGLSRTASDDYGRPDHPLGSIGGSISSIHHRHTPSAPKPGSDFRPISPVILIRSGDQEVRGFTSTPTAPPLRRPTARSHTAHGHTGHQS
jgi:hypothetical protein